VLKPYYANAVLVSGGPLLFGDLVKVTVYVTSFDWFEELRVD